MTNIPMPVPRPKDIDGPKTDTIGAYLDALKPYDDNIDNRLGPSAYSDYINANTNQSKNSDLDNRDFSPGHLQAEQMMDANQSMHDSIQTDPNHETQTPLEELIPKVASGRATPEERARLYSLMDQRT